MKRLLIIIIILLMFTLTVSAKLSDETLKIIEDLRNKIAFSDCIISEGVVIDFDWDLDFLSIWVEGGKLFVETQDGKWFIKMKKIKGEDD